MKCQTCKICNDREFCAQVNGEISSEDFKVKLCESNPQLLHWLKGSPTQTKIIVVPMVKTDLLTYEGEPHKC